MWEIVALFYEYSILKLLYYKQENRMQIQFIQNFKQLRKE